MYTKHRWLWILMGILFLLAAVVILFNPEVNLASLAILFSIAILLSGIAQIAFYFSTPTAFRSGWALLWGIFSVIIAIWIFTCDFETLTLLIPYAFAFWILIGGTSRLVMGLELRYVGGLGSLFIFLGILGILIGLLLLYRPLIGAYFINYLVAALFIYEGIMSFIHFSNSRKSNVIDL